MIRRVASANALSDEFEYDDSNPDWYRAGMARVDKAAGGDERARDCSSGSRLVDDRTLAVAAGEYRTRSQDGDDHEEPRRAAVARLH